MIDDEREVCELIKAIKEYLPMRAFATLSLVKGLRQQGTDVKLNDAVEIDSVLYLGDEGGIACGIGLWGGTTAVITSLTHLRIARDHPLAERIQAYQVRRAERLAVPLGRSSRKSRRRLAAKRK